MKNIYYLITIITLVFVASCTSEEVKPTVVTTSDYTIDVLPTVKVGDTIGIVPGTSNKGTVSYTITSQNPSGALTIGETYGELIVADESFFDPTVTLEIALEVSVSKETINKTSNVVVTIIDITDTDGDGIIDGDEEADGTDPNDPCDPMQDEGYTGYDETNAIWAAADCDSDGETNGTEVANGTDPYRALACDSTVDVSIWSGALSIENTEIGDTTDGVGVAGCGELIVKADVGFFSCDITPEIKLVLTPISDGATNGTVIVEKQRYNCIDGFVINYEATGTYDETTQTIELNYTITEEGFDDIVSTNIIKPN